MKIYQIFFIFSFTFGILGSVRCDDEIDEQSIDFEPCPESNLDECFRDTMQTGLLRHINGSKALNLPPLNPWVIPKQRVNFTTPTGVEIMMIVENVKIYGVEYVKIETVRTSLSEKGLRAVVEVYLPRLEAIGNYKANVKINDLRIRPKGEFNLTISDTHNLHKVVTEFETVNDKKFLKLKSITMDPKVGDIKFNATGIFPDPVLNEVTVKLINQYLPNFYKIIIDDSQSIWEPLIITTMNNFLKRVPFERFVAGGMNTKN